jgi:hypothetical protein
VRISLPWVVTRPTTTGRVTVVPSWTTCTVGLALLPPIAEEGTTTTLRRLAVTTPAWPVMPTRAPVGSLPIRTVTAYWTTVDVPAEDSDDSEVSAISSTVPLVSAPSRASKVRVTRWPTSSLATSSWLTSALATRLRVGARVASSPPAWTRLPTAAVTSSTTAPGL